MLVLGLVDIPWWAFLILLAAAYYWYETRHFKVFEEQGVPGAKPRFFWGTVYKNFGKTLSESQLDAFKEFQEKGFKMFGEFVGRRPALNVWDEAFLAEVLVKEFASFPDHWDFNDPRGFSSKMLVNMEHKKWRHVRSEVSPTFTTGKLKRMNSEIDRCAKMFTDYLMKRAESGDEFDFSKHAGSFTMDVIASTAFGIQLDSQSDPNNPFVTHAKKIFDMDIRSLKLFFIIYFPIMTWFLRKFGLSMDLIPDSPTHFFRKVVKQAMQLRKEETDQSRTDFLQLMLNAQRGEDIQDHDEKIDADIKGLETEEILANAVLFFVAGYDTTATTLSFLMYNLATNPDCQTKLIEEIDQVMGDEEFADYSLTQQMPYLEQCIQETLRLYPVTYNLNRIAKRDVTVNGVFLPENSVVQIPTFAMHRDPQRWPDPEKFDPQRFSAENKQKRSPYHYMPFGYGPRACIGVRLAQQELKVAAVRALRKVTVTVCANTQVPVKFASSILLKAEGGIWLKAVPR